jgi:acyl-CoA hydrolase
VTQHVTLEGLAERIRPGALTFLPGSAGEPAPLLDLWRADPERTRGLHLLTSAIPGINAMRSEDWDPSAMVTGLFMQPGLRAAQAEGRFRHLPVSYGAFVRDLARLSFDTAVVQVAPPDAEGRCSLGPAVEFTPLVVGRSRQRLAVINPLLPAMPGAAFLPLDSFDAVTEVAFAPPGYVVGAPDATSQAIAGQIAAFVEDGSTVQVGLGRVPDALMAMLRDRRRLRLHSGMLADSALPLWECGALDRASMQVSCVLVGSAGFYERLQGWDGVRVMACNHTHDARVLAGRPRLRAVNSALSVDLFGQANLEIAEGRAVSGPGGAPDFARAARLAPDGLSIVALPCAYGREERRSRIVPRLADGIASLGRNDIDLIVTEHGAADLRGRSVHERAEAIIAIADPAFRGALSDAWQDMKKTL